jgi:hypothetical protein
VPNSVLPLLFLELEILTRMALMVSLQWVAGPEAPHDHTEVRIAFPWWGLPSDLSLPSLDFEIITGAPVLAIAVVGEIQMSRLLCTGQA